LVIPLRFWNMRWLGVRFNPETGRGIVWRPGVRVQGVAYLADARWYSLWNNGGRICLQIGRKQWFVDEGWVASIRTEGLHRIFTLGRGTDCVLVKKYRDPRRKWWNRIDPARDQLDDIMDDFWLWMVDVWTDKDSHRRFVDGPWHIPGPDLKCIP
jgi:hypothetical protein